MAQRTAAGGPRALSFPRALFRYRWLYALLIPGLIWLVLFCYLPMFGLVIAFQDYKLFGGVWKSPLIGFDNFAYLFRSNMFLSALGNTFIISAYKLLFGFPVPILFALMMNELRSRKLKRTVQTVLYLPHFLSWVIMFGLIFNFLSEFGPLNKLIGMLGGQPIYFLSDTRYFRGVVVVSDIWKEVGWSAIIYLAALAGISPDLYEAATIDGASRFKCLLHISLPGILPTITIMLLLRVGAIMNVGFDQIFNLYNPAVLSVGDIIDTYVYRIGLLQTKFGYSAAAGMFKSVVALALVLITNFFVKKTEQGGLF
ncbi:protein LplB [Clostridia bacterium]|nr:protein LplB [Clostridia bacterium]